MKLFLGLAALVGITTQQSDIDVMEECLKV